MVTRRGEVNAEGFLLALLGFGITRFVVADSLRTDAALPFLVAGLIPLVLGLGLSVLGVALALGTFRRSYVRTVTLWTFAGTAAMAIVLLLTAVDTVLRGDSMNASLGSGVFVANVLLGGTIGGAITGDRSAANRSSREEIERQVDRVTMINRILRHEVLNGATVVKGYADLLRERHDDQAVDAIREASEQIETTIEDVGDIAVDSNAALGPVDVGTVVSEVCETFDTGAIETDIRDGATARADARLRIVVRELVENALVHGVTEDGDGDGVRVSVGTEGGLVRLRVADDGQGIPERTRMLLESGTLPEYDDPMSGFGLQRVRLLVERYDGEIGVDVDDGTTVTVSLLRVSEDGDPVSALGVDRADIAAAAGAAVAAGVVMGAYLQVATGLLPVIGSLYGVASPVVGWITHLFHSVVFGLLYAAGVTRPTFRPYDSLGERTLLGVGWGVVLSLLAAGVVMPLWLQLTGIAVPFPNTTVPGLVGHVIWGAVLGSLYSLTGR